MPLTFELRSTIAAPPERVFAGITDLDRMGEWMPGFVRIERLTEGPLRKGSQFRMTRRMFGREATEQFEVADYDPPRVFGLFVDGTKGSSRSGWFRFRQTIAPTGGGTHLVMSGECGGASGCMAFLGKLMLGPMKKAMAKDLAAQKAWIEKGAATGS